MQGLITMNLATQAQSKALSEVSLTDIAQMNKKDLAEFSQLCIDTWCEDSEDKAKTLVLAAKMLLFAESIKKTLAQSSIDFVSRQGKGYVTNNAKLEVAEVGVSYSYDNSPAYVYINTEINEIKAKIEPLLEPLMEQLDDICKIAKATKQRTDWISEEGETYTIYPAVKKGTETVKVSVL